MQGKKTYQEKLFTHFFGKSIFLNF